jgi:putative phosphoesterase
LTLGIISDTHGYLDPKVAGLFDGVKHIFHAGDIGCASIIVELEQIAPVTAVLGNNDAGLNFNETEVIELGGHKFLVHHILVPFAPHAGIQPRLAQEDPDVVIFGHSHQPHCQTIAGTLYFNPGYAGKPRFNQRRSVAILRCDASGVRTEFISL